MRPLTLYLMGFLLLATACSNEGRAKLLAEDVETVADASGDSTLPSDIVIDSSDDTRFADVCVPNCVNMECGDDGCGGSCGDCPQAAPICGTNGLCEIVCIPDCETANKECGNDGCDSSCGNCPQVAPYCVDFICAVDCTPDCTDAVCGDDGCGGSCGECEDGSACLDGECVCQPDCPPGGCGDDGCGGSCDGCSCDETCENGTCEFVGCGEQECGDDGCGESCGACPAGSECLTELCIDGCEAACKDKECGSDGCGGLCGSCADDLICTDFGECVGQCTPGCDGVECGPNGCGGSCGICAFMPDGYCLAGECVEECVPSCGTKVCGSDGCAGSCGDCAGPLQCTAAGTCGGYCSQCTFHADCYDINFSDGSLGNWSINASHIVTNLGETVAPTGGYMLKLTTGEGVTEFSSDASFQNCLPAGAYMMLVKWQLYSEEFKEWCGSNYQDSFSIEVKTAAVSEVLASYTIDDLCVPGECEGCGDAFAGLVQSDVAFDQGDVWNTPWLEDWMPISLADAESLFTLALTLEDAGDGIYDTVLLVDRIRFVPCDQACDFVECGINPCGEVCGECDGGGICQDGTCCYPDCSGKECGSDGCGGSCGQCGSLTACSSGGLCKCKFEECADGCCLAGEVCAAISGKCCEADCAGTPCASDGCGGTCPAANGQECCTSASDCDDGDDLCTEDLCVAGSCSYEPTGNLACCESFAWEEDFDTGEAPGFTITNSSGGGIPGIEVGWSVSDACGNHSAPYSLYFGMASGLFGQCLYSIGFPGMGGFEGTATTPSIALPADPATLTFWYVADILPAEPTETLSLTILHNGLATILWTKADVAAIGPEWHKATIDLHPFADKNVKLEFSFATVGAQQSGGKGILIDDLSIATTCGP